MHRARLPWWMPLIVVAALAGSIGVLTSCKLIGDPGTGLSLQRSAVAACITACNGDHVDLIHAEIELHQSNVRDCEALPEADREACLEAEAERHQTVMHQLAEDRKDCQNDCHKQGNGGGN